MSVSSTEPLQKIVICMGSQSDWPCMKSAADILHDLEIACDIRIISAHRTPDRLAKFASTALAYGAEVIIAGAGGAAHLPGMIAAHTILPVLGVPVESKALKGMDSLLSIVQMQAAFLSEHWQSARQAQKMQACLRHKFLACLINLSRTVLSLGALPKLRLLQIAHQIVNCRVNDDE